MASRKLFRRVHHQGQREAIRHRLEHISYLIPSLDTLIKNLGWLEPCCAVLFNIVTIPRGRSLRKSLLKAYSRPIETLIQWNEQDFRRRQPGEVAEDANFDYVQMWLFAMRNFPDMTEFATRESTDTRRPCTKLNARLVQDLGATAFRLGFRTSKAVALKNEDPERALAGQFTEDVGLRPGAERAQFIEEVTDLLKRALQTTPTFSSRSARRLESVDEPQRRAGRPRDDFFRASRNHLYPAPLFRPYVYDEVNPVFISRDFLVNFLRVDVGYAQRIYTQSQSEANVLSLPPPLDLGTADTVMHENDLQERVSDLQEQLAQSEVRLLEFQTREQAAQHALTETHQNSSQTLEATRGRVSELEVQLEQIVGSHEDLQNQLRGRNDTVKMLNDQINRIKLEHQSEVRSLFEIQQRRSAEFDRSKRENDEAMQQRARTIEELEAQKIEREAQQAQDYKEQRRLIEEQSAQYRERNSAYIACQSQCSKLESDLQRSYAESARLRKEAETTKNLLQNPAPRVPQREKSMLSRKRKAPVCLEPKEPLSLTYVTGDGSGGFKENVEYIDPKDDELVRRKVTAAMEGCRLENGKNVIMLDRELRSPSYIDRKWLSSAWRTGRVMYVVEQAQEQLYRERLLTTKRPLAQSRSTRKLRSDGRQDRESQVNRRTDPMEGIERRDQEPSTNMSGTDSEETL